MKYELDLGTVEICKLVPNWSHSQLTGHIGQKFNQLDGRVGLRANDPRRALPFDRCLNVVLVIVQSTNMPAYYITKLATHTHTRYRYWPLMISFWQSSLSFSDSISAN